MLAALRVFWRSIVQFEHYGWLYVLANILSIALSLPIITAPAAFAGLSHMSHVSQTSSTTTIGEFWIGFRAALPRSIVIGLINLAIVVMLAVNIIYYSVQTGILFVFLRAIWLIILIGWLGIQLYLWPILDEMETPTLRGGLRNAGVMVLQNPVFSLMLLLMVGVFVVLSTVLLAPWMLVTNRILACIANAAVLDRLALVRAK